MDRLINIQKENNITKEKHNAEFIVNHNNNIKILFKIKITQIMKHIEQFLPYINYEYIYRVKKGFSTFKLKILVVLKHKFKFI